MTIRLNEDGLCIRFLGYPGRLFVSPELAHAERPFFMIDWFFTARRDQGRPGSICNHLVKRGFDGPAIHYWRQYIIEALSTFYDRDALLRKATGKIWPSLLPEWST